MKHIKLKNAEIFDKVTAKTFEYNLPDKDINWCIVDVKGRFPEKGWAMNTQCKEMVFVISGKGKLVVKDKGEITFNCGCCAYIITLGQVFQKHIFHFAHGCRQLRIYVFVVLWCCGVVVLWCCGVVVLWCCGVVVLWCCGVVVLWCCGVVVLWCCAIVQ